MNIHTMACRSCETEVVVMEDVGGVEVMVVLSVDMVYGGPVSILLFLVRTVDYIMSWVLIDFKLTEHSKLPTIA